MNLQGMTKNVVYCLLMSDIMLFMYNGNQMIKIGIFD